MTDKYIQRNTLSIQVRELVEFMGALGYEPYRTAKGIVFASDVKECSSNRLISLQNAIRIYNSGRYSPSKTCRGVVMSTDQYMPGFQFPATLMIKAVGAKMLHKVNLRWDSVNEAWATSNHWLKFANYSYGLLRPALAQLAPVESD